MSVTPWTPSVVIDSDDGPDSDRLSIWTDDQGDIYIGTIRSGERVCMHGTRLCGPGGGCRAPAVRLAALVMLHTATGDVDRAKSAIASLMNVLS